jgi:hypothetical protein
MQTYFQTDELQKYIDWDNLMSMPRYAGGHDCQMQGLFKNVEVIAHWNEGDYQGDVATCVKLTDGKYKDHYVIYNDYYGSCSGCDSWEDACDDAVRNMCINLSNGAYVFNSLDDIIEFLEAPDRESRWGWSSSTNGLLKIILSRKDIVRDKTINEVLK